MTRNDWLRIWAIADLPYALADTTRQALGMMVLGLGFVVLAIAQDRATRYGSVGPQWLFAVYALHTLGELMLSPVGLASSRPGSSA